MKDIREIKVSIIIPVYNIKSLLDMTLQSVVKQTHQNIEVILVDDGSTDGSGDVCDLWEKKDRRIKCFHKINEGVSVARNYGFAQSDGECILFIDGDDEIAPDMCEKLLHKLSLENADVSYCGFLNIFQDEIQKQIPKEKKFEKEEILYALVTDAAFFSAIWNKMFRRNVLLDEEGQFIQFEQGIYVGEDALWLSKVLKNVKKVFSVSEPLYFWKRREDSATQGKSVVRIDEKYLTILKAYRSITLEIDDKKLKRIMCKKYLGISRDCMIQAYKQNEKRLVDELMKKIVVDRKLYDKFDLFMIKLNVCLLLVSLKIPVVLLEKIQNI